MIYWLALVASQLREERDVSRQDVASRFRVDPSTIYRFESGRGWPRDTDVMVAAYAKALGIDDARDIWKIALDMYLTHGTPPTLDSLTTRDPGPPEQVVAAIRRADQATRRRSSRSPQTRGARAS